MHRHPIHWYTCSLTALLGLLSLLVHASFALTSSEAPALLARNLIAYWGAATLLACSLAVPLTLVIQRLGSGAPALTRGLCAMLGPLLLYAPELVLFAWRNPLWGSRSRSELVLLNLALLVGSWLLGAGIWQAVDRARKSRVQALSRPHGSLAVGVTLLLLFVITSAVATANQRSKPSRGVASQESPNVLLVVVDALTWHVLGTYGGFPDVSPNLDRLGAQGTVFDNFIASAPMSVPGHASLLFGEPIESHGGFNNFALPVSHGPTLADRFRERGYDTVGVCRNGLINRGSGFGAGFDFYWSTGARSLEGAPLSMVALQLPWVELALRNTDRDLVSLYSRQVLGASDRPWFGFVQYIFCHDPYTDPREPPWLDEARLARIDALREAGTWPVDPSVDPEFATWTRGTYLSSVNYVDSVIADLLAWLDDRGVADDTIVAITADHGENLGEHPFEPAFGHSRAYNTVLRIPLVIFDPRSTDPPKRVRGVHAQHELGDLLFDVLDADSRSEDQLAPRQEVSEPCVAMSFNTFAVLTDSTKLILPIVPTEGVRPELYRWREDPWERIDLFEALPSEVERLQERAEWFAEHYDVRARRADVRVDFLDAERRRMLQSLGYL